MSTDPRKRQRKLARHAAKRKTKHHQLVREKSEGLADRLAAAANYPVLDCCVTEDFWNHGLGWVCLSRQFPNGAIAYGNFLVDRYCLGVKNAMADVVSRFTYDSTILQKLRGELRARDVSPAAARKIVESAVAYAADLGFPPHPDYHKAKLVFGTIDPTECTEEFEFGKDGQPFFISGPHDSPLRCQQIINTLKQRCGQDNYHFLMPLAGPPSETNQFFAPSEYED